MSEPTLTRAQLRRILARRLQMPFAQRIGDTSTMTASTSTTAVRDSAKLGQADDYWNGTFLYNITRDTVAYIADFADATNEATLEQAITGQTSGDTYEIHSIWSANELHGALNDALRQADRVYWDYVIDETMVLEEDKLNYALGGLASAPQRLLQVWIEHNLSGTQGVVTSAAVGSITDTALIGYLSSAGVTAGWLVSIYKGTGSGQLRTVSTINNTTGQVSVSSNWTTTPDTTSRYRLWNPNEQRVPWERVTYGRPDQKEWPDYFYFDILSPEDYGLRIRWQYIGRPNQLTTEASTTMVPEGYLIPKAMSILYAGKQDDTRLDRSRYAQLSQDNLALAERFMQTFPFRMPDGTLWQSAGDQMIRGSLDRLGNPLGWR